MLTRAAISAAVVAASLGATAATASAGSIAVTGPPTVAEAAGTATFTVTETRGPGETLPAGGYTITASGGSATLGADFGAPSPAGGTLSTGSCIAINKCQVISSVTVPIVADTLFEGGESFTVSVDAPAGVSTSGATTTISDDDPAPPLEVDGDRVTEGDAGATSAKASFELKAPSALPVTVHWTTEDGTATAGSDYTPRSGTTTIKPGDEEGHASIPVLGDTTVEPDEQFRVRVTSVTNATLDDDSARITIANDDVPPPPPAPLAPLTGAAPAKGGTTPAQQQQQQHAGLPPTAIATTTTRVGSGPDMAGPAVRLAYAGLSSKGALKLRVACPATEPDLCAVRVRAHIGDTTLGAATARLHAGEVQLMRIHLSRRARRTLRRKGTFAVSLRARDAAGNVATATATFAQ